MEENRAKVRLGLDFLDFFIFLTLFLTPAECWDESDPLPYRLSINNACTKQINMRWIKEKDKTKRSGMGKKGLCVTYHPFQFCLITARVYVLSQTERENSFRGKSCGLTAYFRLACILVSLSSLYGFLRNEKDQDQAEP